MRIGTKVHDDEMNLRVRRGFQCTLPKSTKTPTLPIEILQKQIRETHDRSLVNIGTTSTNQEKSIGPFHIDDSRIVKHGGSNWHDDDDDDGDAERESKTGAVV